MVFWASPGINADTMEVKQGRLCNSTTIPPIKAGPSQAPENGNKNAANLLTDGNKMFGGLEKWAVEWPGSNWKDIEATVKYSA